MRRKRHGRKAREAVEGFLAVLCYAGEAVGSCATFPSWGRHPRKPQKAQEGTEGKLGTVEAMEEGKKAI